MGTEQQLNDSIIWTFSGRLALLYTFYFILFFTNDAQYLSFCLGWHKSIKAKVSAPLPFVDFTKQFCQLSTHKKAQNVFKSASVTLSVYDCDCVTVKWVMTTWHAIIQ